MTSIHRLVLLLIHEWQCSTDDGNGKQNDTTNAGIDPDNGDRNQNDKKIYFSVGRRLYI